MPLSLWPQSKAAERGAPEAGRELSGYRAVVIGGSIAGLAAALALNRRGAEVCVLERDDRPPSEEANAAFFSWHRPGVPQLRHSHVFLGRLRSLLLAHYPDFLERLLAAGAREMRPLDRPPPTLGPVQAQPGDEELVTLAMRRVTFEIELRKLVEAQPGIRIENGVEAVSLVAVGSRPPAVRAVDVRARSGRVRRETAHFLVDASGRRSQVSLWLRQLGARPLVERQESSGIVYYTRYYRLRRAGKEPAPGNDPWVGDHDWVKYAIFPAEEGIFSITLAVPVAEQRLKVLAKPAAFDALVRAIPGLRDWLDPWIAAPLEGVPRPVEAMGGLLNRRRSLVDAEGPVALRLFLTGDAAYCTNPLYGRGCTQAFLQAHLLASVLAETAGDWQDAAREYERQSRALLLPYYRASVLADRDAVRRSEGRPPRAWSERLTERFYRDGVAVAMRVDPVVFRAFLRMINMFEPPEEAFRKPEVVARTLLVMAQAGSLRERFGWSEPPQREATIAACLAAAAQGNGKVRARQPRSTKRLGTTATGQPRAGE